MMDGITSSKLSQLMNFIDAFENMSAASSRSLKRIDSREMEAASTADTDDVTSPRSKVDRLSISNSKESTTNTDNGTWRAKTDWRSISSISSLKSLERSSKESNAGNFASIKEKSFDPISESALQKMSQCLVQKSSKESSAENFASVKVESIDPISASALQTMSQCLMQKSHTPSVADDDAFLATPDPLDFMPYTGVSPKYSEQDIADAMRRLEEDMARQQKIFCRMMLVTQVMR
jgi:hypothetical protein